MKIDINETLSEMAKVVKLNIKEDWNEVKPILNQFLQNRKERLELLSDLRLNNEISQEKFERRLKDEKLILEAELHAIAVVSKAIAQKAANAAIEVLEKAVTTLLKAII